MKHLLSIGCAILTLLPAGVRADVELIRINRVDCTIEEVVDEEPRHDCPTDAACRKRGERVKWQVKPPAKYSIVFSGASPFENAKCLSGKGVCKVADNAPPGDYEYDVYIEGCAAFDPRIRVRI